MSERITEPYPTILATENAAERGLYGVWRGITYDTSPGSPFDCGVNDSRWRSPNSPMMGKVGERIYADAMTLAEREAYWAGYAWNDMYGETDSDVYDYGEDDDGY